MNTFISMATGWLASMLMVASGAVLLLAATAVQAGPSVPDKAEVVFADDFDSSRAEHWSGGKLVSDAPAGAKGAYQSADAKCILSRACKFVSTEQTWMSFRYYARNCYSLCVQFQDTANGDNFKTFICPIVRDGWGTVRFNITADIQGCSNHVAGIKAGDKLSGVLIWPDNKLPGATLMIDDAAIYTMTPEARMIELAAKVEKAIKDWDCQDCPEKEMFGKPSEATAENIAQLEKKAAGLADSIHRAWLVRQTQAAFKLEKAEYAVGLESPLVRISDRNSTMDFAGTIANSFELSSAGHEYENIQLVVMTNAKPLEKVAISLPDLIGPGGAKVAKENLEWRIAEDVCTKPSYGYARSIHGFKPDPLMPGEPFDLPAGRTKCVWLTAYVPPETPPGDYSGTVAVAPANSHPVSLQMRLHVWNYRMPIRGRFRHMCQFQPQAGGNRRDNYAFLLKYRLSPTAQYSRSCSPAAEDIQFCLDRGITTFVAGNHPGPEINVEAVKPYYEALKAAGCVDLAVVYIGDEGTSPKHLAEYRAKAELVKRQFPGLRALVGGSTPRPELAGFVDLWDPIISQTASRGSGYEFNKEAVDERKALGETVMWYMAGVRPPYPCIELDPPTPSLRMFPWVTWKYGVGGWEVYGTQGGWDKPDNKLWPKAPWDTYTWRNYNGSGQFFYPGPKGVPLASIRIENARDGIEDFEALALLEEAIAMAGQKPHKLPDLNLLDQAKKLVAVPPEMLTNMWDWTRDPKVIAATRIQLGSTLDKLVTALGRKDFEQFCQGRADQRRKLDNELYQKRLEAFLAKQASQPASGLAPATK